MQGTQRCCESCGMNPPTAAAPQVARTLPSAFDFHHSTSGDQLCSTNHQSTLSHAFQERGFLPPTIAMQKSPPSEEGRDFIQRCVAQ